MDGSPRSPLPPRIQTRGPPRRATASEPSRFGSLGLLCLAVLTAAPLSAQAQGELALGTGLATRLMLAQLTPPPPPPELDATMDAGQPDAVVAQPATLVPERRSLEKASKAALARPLEETGDVALQARLTALRLELHSLPRDLGPSGWAVGGMTVTLGSLLTGLVGLPVTALGAVLLLAGNPALFSIGLAMLAVGAVGIPVGAIIWSVGALVQAGEQRKLDDRRAALRTEDAAITAELIRRSPALIAPFAPETL